MLIHRYVFRELLGPTLLGLFVYTSLLVVHQLFRIAQVVFAYQQMSFADGALSLFYLLPSIVVQTIPMSVLLGILIGFSRLSADSEITAMRATGISYYRLLVPTALLALLGWAACGATYLWAVPWSNTRAIEMQIGARQQADLNRGITPGEWQRVDQVALFARGLDVGDDGRPWLSDVDILIQQPASHVREHWRAGRVRVERVLAGESSGRLRFDLRDVHGLRWNVAAPEGNIQVIQPAREADRLGPERHIDTARETRLRETQKDSRMKTLSELHAFLETLDAMDRVDAMTDADPTEIAKRRAELPQWITPSRRQEERALALMEIHKKFAIPLASLVFALCGMPLGIATRRGGRPASFLVALGVIALWYVIYVNAEAWVRVDKLAPAIGAWLPDVVLAVVGVTLLVRLRRQQRLSAYRVLHDAVMLAAIVLLLLAATLSLQWWVHPPIDRQPFPSKAVVALAITLGAWALLVAFHHPIARVLSAAGEAVRRPFRRRRSVRPDRPDRPDRAQAAVGRPDLDGELPVAPARDPGPDADRIASRAWPGHDPAPEPPERERRRVRRRLLEGARNVTGFALAAVLAFGAVQLVQSEGAWQRVALDLIDSWLGATLLVLGVVLGVLQVAGARSMRVLTWWTLASYLRAFALLIASMLLLFVIGDYVNIVRDVMRNDVSGGIVVSYFRHALPQMIAQVLPVAAMVAALVVFGVMTKFNETTAAICCGVSVFRLAAPIVLFALAISGAAFVVEDRILPASNQRAEELKDVIRGREPSRRAPRGHGAAIAEGGDAIYQYQAALFGAEEHGGPAARLLRLAVLRFGDDGRVEELIHAREAHWSELGTWRLIDGWRAEIRGGRDVAVSRFRDRLAPDLEPADYFAEQEQDPDLMPFGEYREYIAQQAQLAYPTHALEVQLHRKLALPLATFVLVLVALPFAFTTGRRGALHGLGLALILFFVYYGALAVFLALGEGGFLPPVVAAWAPNVLFALGGVYLFLHVRT